MRVRQCVQGSGRGLNEHAHEKVERSESMDVLGCAVDEGAVGGVVSNKGRWVRGRGAVE